MLLHILSGNRSHNPNFTSGPSKVVAFVTNNFPLSYCHIWGVCVTNITGSGFDDWIYWHFLQLQPIITAHTELRITTPVWQTPSWMNSTEHSHVSSLFNFVMNEWRSPFPTVHVTGCLSVAAGTVCLFRSNALVSLFRLSGGVYRAVA
jgi:hypothetical protein